MRVKVLSEKGKQIQTPKVSTIFIFPQDKTCSHCKSVVELESIVDIDHRRYDVGYGAYSYKLDWTCPACKARNTLSTDEVDIAEWKRLRPFNRFTFW